VWGEVLEHLQRAFKKSPFEQRVFNPSLQFFGNKSLYKVRLSTFPFTHINLL
jgi:hypothetical protein